MILKDCIILKKEYRLNFITFSVKKDDYLQSSKKILLGEIVNIFKNPNIKLIEKQALLHIFINNTDETDTRNVDIEKKIINKLDMQYLQNIKYNDSTQTLCGLEDKPIAEYMQSLYIAPTPISTIGSNPISTIGSNPISTIDSKTISKKYIAFILIVLTLLGFGIYTIMKNKGLKSLIPQKKT